MDKFFGNAGAFLILGSLLFLFVGCAHGAAPATAIQGAAAKELQDELCFVQFHHPGLEHEPDLPGERSWNTGVHKRKFMVARAARWRGPGDEARISTVAFWGEWEMPSIVIAELDRETPEHPGYLYKPLIAPFSESNPPLQNTDPYVFADSFLYGNCKQNDDQGPTALQGLKRGSVIVFGSNIGGDRFVLDTVLVVDRYVQYTTDDFEETLKGIVSNDYLDAAPRPIAYESRLSQPGRTFTYRLYIGASPLEPQNEMFSFVPCMLWDEESSTAGFARPVIRFPGLFDDTLATGQIMNPQSDPEAVKALWNNLVAQVRQQGLWLCTDFYDPDKRWD